MKMTQNKFSNPQTATTSLVIMPKAMMLANTATLRGAVLKLMNKGINRLVVDLHQVEFIDSSGLSVLISALKRAQQSQGEVVLLNPSNNVRALIELTQLHQIFPIYEDKEAAVEYVNEQARLAFAAEDAQLAH
ncbi:STAS domain-containing protein [Shewanella gelidii]|uniref:Anti-sigma factor antagonist n=1 Tax=Shewanella gelidii TaxID=1642821 RepID=A0A917JJF7_9GAMM|nr:STAS domain-containing protein [Shewanella gelidii]MCL1096401.1 STAS domain-containing protein [Shewanella gelidii]GGI67187.1 hypothetical protein GCM10009332_00290 [Shewanella gelidii]